MLGMFNTKRTERDGVFAILEMMTVEIDRRSKVERETASKADAGAMPRGFVASG